MIKKSDILITVKIEGETKRYCAEVNLSIIVEVDNEVIPEQMKNRLVTDMDIEVYGDIRQKLIAMLPKAAMQGISDGSLYDELNKVLDMARIA
jgi:hypothetical protein